MIEVVPYNKNWPLMFESEKLKIQDVLKDNCIEIHHIGSTSVPGLDAKPKIDIIVVSKDRENVIPKMELIGYQYKGEWNIPFKYGFAKRGELDVNLHMFFDKNHPEIELNLGFRDYLRTHPEDLEAYKNIKYEILSDPSSHIKSGKLGVPLYTLRKRKFIDGIIKQMGYDRLRVLKCLTDNEWLRAEQLYTHEIAISEREDENLEHFLLYKGIEILVYARINLSLKSFKIFGNLSISELDFFNNLINNWILCKFNKAQS